MCGIMVSYYLNSLLPLCYFNGNISRYPYTNPDYLIKSIYPNVGIWIIGQWRIFNLLAFRAYNTNIQPKKVEWSSYIFSLTSNRAFSFLIHAFWVLKY